MTLFRPAAAPSKLVLSAAAVLVPAALGLAACNRFSAPSPPPPALERIDLETPVPLGEWQIVVNRGELYRELTGPGGPEASERGLWAAAYLIATNGGPTAAALRRSDFQLVDRSGTRYPPSERAVALGLAEREGLRPFTASVPPGGRLETVLVFEAPFGINLPQLLVNPISVAIYLQ